MSRPKKRIMLAPSGFKSHSYTQYYLQCDKYNEWLTLKELAALPECAVTKGCLQNRLTAMFRSAKNRNKKWGSVWQCMTTSGEKYAEQNIEFEEFLSIMKLWPARIVRHEPTTRV